MALNYIASPMVESFFLIIPPGLEGYASAELREKIALLSKLKGTPIEYKVAQKSRGGILLECERSVGFALNHWLRIPTRILLRLESFKCKDFPKLFNRLRKLPWHNFLRQGQVEFSVSVVESRMKIKEQIASTAQDALKDCQKHQPFRKSFLDTPQTIFIRVKQDEVFVSIDTSGPGLFKRGHKLLTVDAPIRETLASALLWPLISRNPEGKLVDMMAGSGTLGFEALSYYHPLKNRKFAYQNFPEVTDAEKFIGKVPLKKSHLTLEAIEIHDKHSETLKKNAEVFLKTFDLSVETKKQDVFEADLANAHLVCNPPYDERLASDTKGLAKSLTQLFEKSQPHSISLVWPGERPPQLGFKWTNTEVTENGGIPVTLNFWTKSNSESPKHVVRKQSAPKSSEAN